MPKKASKPSSSVEKSIMDWANDPLSSANVEDPVDSLEEEIRKLPCYSTKVLASGGIHATACVQVEDVMLAIRHYRARIWELKEKGTRGEKR
jgi:hypothetical protein